MIWKPHVTVAAVIEQSQQFLFVEEMIDGKLMYNQPAGHLEADESLIDAVIRETQEETAYQFTPLSVIGIMLWKNTHNAESFLRVVFHGTVANLNPKQKLDDGIVRTVWRTRQQIIQQQEKLRSPLVLNAIDDYLAGKKYPLTILSHLNSSII